MKVHFISSAEPLKEGSDILAPCQQTVPRAAFVMSMDTRAMANVMDWGAFRNACQKCLRIPLNERFVYAITNGEAVRHPEDSL